MRNKYLGNAYRLLMICLECCSSVQIGGSYLAQGKLDPVVGRQPQIERVTQILGRRTKNNPCLIGEPGVGKTAIAEGLAQRIATGDVPETIEGKKVRRLSTRQWWKCSCGSSIAVPAQFAREEVQDSQHSRQEDPPVTY